MLREEAQAYADEYNAKLVKGCIAILTQELPQNRCNIVLTHPGDDEPPFEATSYAARYWIEHVCLIKNPSDDLAIIIDNFMLNHFLHWVEFLSIIRPTDLWESLPRLLKYIEVRLNLSV